MRGLQQSRAACRQATEAGTWRRRRRLRASAAHPLTQPKPARPFTNKQSLHAYRGWSPAGPQSPCAPAGIKPKGNQNTECQRGGGAAMQAVRLRQRAAQHGKQPSRPHSCLCALPHRVVVGLEGGGRRAAGAGGGAQDRVQHALCCDNGVAAAVNCEGQTAAGWAAAPSIESNRPWCD